MLITRLISGNYFSREILPSRKIFQATAARATKWFFQTARILISVSFMQLFPASEPANWFSIVSRTITMRVVIAWGREGQARERKRIVNFSLAGFKRQYNRQRITSSARSTLLVIYKHRGETAHGINLSQRSDYHRVVFCSSISSVRTTLQLRVCAGHRTTGTTFAVSWTAKLNRPRGDVKVMARVKLTTFATFPEA